jgi:hypothetical protein
MPGRLVFFESSTRRAASSRTLRAVSRSIHEKFFFLRLIQQAQESAKLDYSAARRGAAIELPITFYSKKVLCPFHPPSLFQPDAYRGLDLGRTAVTREPPPQKANVAWLDKSLRKERQAHEQVAKLHQEERAQEARSRKRQRETVSEGEEIGEKPEKRAKSDQTDAGKEKKRKSSEKKEIKRKEKGEVKGASEAKPLKQGTQDGRTVSVVAVQTTGEVAEERRRRKNAKRIRRRARTRQRVRRKKQEKKNDKEQESAGGGARGKEEEGKSGSSEETSGDSSSSS